MLLWIAVAVAAIVVQVTIYSMLAVGADADRATPAAGIGS